MKTITILILFIVSVFYSYGQSSMSIKLHNGNIEKGMYKYVNYKFISKKNKRKIHIKDVAELIIHENESNYHFYIIKVGYIVTKPGIGYGFAKKIFKNAKIDVFHAFFSSKKIEIDRLIGFYYNPRGEIFAKKKDDKLTYRIGFMDGYGWYKTKKRLKTFFYDCPELFSEMKKRKIDEKQTFKVLSLYTKLCDATTVSPID